MDIDIDPAAVHAVGDSVAALARQASTRVAHCLDTTTVAANAHPGWRVSGAALSCQNAWEVHLGHLVSEIGSIAQMIHAAASAIQQADAEAVRRLHEALTELSH